MRKIINRIIRFYQEDFDPNDLKKWMYFVLMLLGVALCFDTAAQVLDGFDRLRDPRNQYDYVGRDDVRGARNFMIRLFKSGGVAVFVLALFIALFAVIKLLVSENTEEDFKKWRNALVWSLAGLFLISISYYIVDVFDVDNGVITGDRRESIFDGQTASRMLIKVVYPMLGLLRYLAAFFFLFAAIYGYYRMVAGAADEGSVKSGKKTFFNAIIGFILVLIAEPFVAIIYTGTNCRNSVFNTVNTECQQRSIDTLEFMGLFAKIIIFLNGLVALVTLIFVIYAGFLVLTSAGNDERNQKARKIFVYAFIGLLILVFSYAIYRFFLLQE